MRRLAVLALVVLPLAPTMSAWQSSESLPDRETFLAAARQRLAGNEVLQSRFTYRERVTEVRMNPLGRIGTGPVDLYEVYPMPDEDLTYRRLVERAGTPVPRTELVRSDRQYLAQLDKWRRDLEREGQSARVARQRKQDAEREKDRQRSQEAVGLFDFTLARRETLDGQPAIVVAFKPKASAQPQSREGKIAASFAGEAWIHEHEYEVMRVKAQAVTDTSFGFGVIGKLYKGTDALFRREKLNGTWLPVETKVTGSGRALFRKMPIDYVREYLDYRPFNPDDLPKMLGDATSNK